MQTFRVGGAGGGGKDTCDSGVRIVHKASGATGKAVDTRSQHKNKQLAFKRMGESKEFQMWARLECARRKGQEEEIEKIISEQLLDKNLKIEYI